MAEDIFQSFEEINKLIFVKQYEVAFKKMGKILKKRPEKEYLIIRLRQIELAHLLQFTEFLREQYVLETSEDSIPRDIGEICISLLDQCTGRVDPEESVHIFTDIIEKFGPSASAYYGLGFAFEKIAQYEKAIFNYEKSISLDNKWHPSYFGLSQIYYQKDNHEKGDHYFYLFERLAPYNLYGNFDTHKALSIEFMSQRKFDEAETAVTTLTDWWLDNKGSCPPEVQIYESVTLSHLYTLKKDHENATFYRHRLIQRAEEILQDKDVSEESLFFIGSALEEFNEQELSLKYFKELIIRSNGNIETTQKIGGQYLMAGKNDIAREIFEESAKLNPHNPEIRFCLLVTKLKKANVNVENYLEKKERIRRIIENQGDKVELLSLLHNLTAMFQEDPDNLGYMGDIYYKLGNKERALDHYEKMYALDGIYPPTAIKFASFLISRKNFEKAATVLENFREDSYEDIHLKGQISWLKSIVAFSQKDYKKSYELISRSIELDRWNFTYLCQISLCLACLNYPEDQSLKAFDCSTLVERENYESVIKALHKGLSSYVRDHKFELAYEISRLLFIYSQGDKTSLERVVKIATQFNPHRAIKDLLKLLNTNLDSPKVSYSIGLLYKELWRLETASCWFEEVLEDKKTDSTIRNQTYIELSDCYIFQKQNIDRAIEHLHIALEQTPNNQRAITTLAHAYLIHGKIREASAFIEKHIQQHDLESLYLMGLLEFRNGFAEKAKAFWKPLIAQKTHSIRDHHIKQEMLKYYFENKEYAYIKKAN